jgi:hypothetical protein
VVAEFRHRECLNSGDKGYGSKGWMVTARCALFRYGMHAEWAHPDRMVDYGHGEWRDRVYEAVNTYADSERHNRMLSLPSTAEYSQVKAWGRTSQAYAFSSGEVDRLGQHTPERYLDDRRCLKGTRLKLLCRLGCMPVMERVGREQRPQWPKQCRVCMTCGSGEIEDVQHFLLGCPAYARHRVNMLTRVGGVLRRARVPLNIDMNDMDRNDRCRVLLGQRMGDPIVEDQIDRYVKQYLVKAWNTRTPVTKAINNVLGTKYEVMDTNIVSM